TEINFGLTGTTYYNDADADRVSNFVESRVPNLFRTGTGDGNGDGTLDRLQSNVSSLPWKELPGGKVTYFTLANKPGIEHVTVTPLPSPTLAGNDLSLPYGNVNFLVNKAPLNQSVKFSFFTDANAPVNGFWTQNKAGEWVNLATNISLIDGKYRVDLQITDGSPFDLTPSADGKLQIQGGLGWKQSASAFSNISADWDSDGIPDAVETKMGTNPIVKDNNVLQRADMFAMQMYRDFLFREADTAG
ncbi:choice-of-anchor U domain-containing protein, partial [Undibacterium danionis]